MERSTTTLSAEELQILYMDRDRIERINPSVLGTMYQACVQSLHNAHGTRMKVMADEFQLSYGQRYEESDGTFG